MAKISRFRFLIKLLIIALFFNLLPFQKSLAAVTPPLTNCYIRIDNPHISKYILRTQGILAVKVNARSKCNQPMRDLILTVEIHKTGLLRDYRLNRTRFKVVGRIFANQVIKNEDTYVKCINQKPSSYYGVAYASAVIDGKLKKTLKVTSAKNVRLACGN